jgi:hypothetical protein
MVLGRPLLVVAALTLVAYALSPLLPAWASAWIGVPIVLVFCVVLPGYAVSQLAGQRFDDPLERATHVFANGILFMLAAAFAWALTGASIDAFRTTLPVLILALMILSPPRDFTRVDPLRAPIRPRDRRLLAVLALLIIQPVIGVALVGPPLEISNDTIDHAGYVAEIARTGDPFPVTAIYFSPGTDGEDFRKALLHAIYGFTVRHTGASPVDVFAMYGAFLLLVMTLVVYTTSRTLLRRHRLAAAIAVVLFLVGTDWRAGDQMVRVAFYPNRFGAAFLLLFIAAAAEYVHRGPAAALRWCVAYAFAATAVHVQYAMLVCGVAAVFVLWKPCSPLPGWGEHLARTLRLAFAALAGALPFALYRVLTAYQANPLHDQVQAAMFVTDRWFVADPLRLWQVFGPVGIAALVCIGPLWSRRREVPGVGYAIAAFITVLAVELVPFIVTPLYSVFRYLVFRLDIMVPFYLLPAFLVAVRPPRARFALAVTLVAVAAAALPLVRHTAFSSSKLDAERRRGPDRWARGLYQLANALPHGSVIASDPVTSYLVSAFTPYYVVCTLDQHAPPNDLRVEERMNAARDIVSPYTGARDKERLIRENRVTHVVINQALPPGLILNYWTLEPAAAEDAEETFESLRYEFEKIPLDDGLTAFRWREEERLSTLPRAVPRPVVDSLPSYATPIGAAAGEATLVGAALHGAGIIPAGGELVMDLYWSCGTSPPPGTYVVTVRFDRKQIELPFAGRPFPKITRKLVEKAKRERYRFREDHMILGGLFGPDAWSSTDIVEDGVRVRVPTDMAPGRYRVEAKMRKVANQPNQWMRDYFFDDDSYSGVAIGEVTIQRW